MMAKETWKPVPDAVYKKAYEVSDRGNVRNTRTGKMLSPQFVGMRRNYIQVSLSLRGNLKNFRVHRLVAKAFLLNPENKPEVNHKNGVTADNRVENLEWCTLQENANHRLSSGMYNKIRVNDVPYSYVYPCDHGGKWFARVQTKGKTISAKAVSSIKEAAINADFIILENNLNRKLNFPELELTFQQAQAVAA